MLPTWSRGRPAALDVHVISPLQRLIVEEAAITPGHALQVGIRRKLSAHLSDCRAVGVDFIPLVAEALGGLAEDTIATVTRIGETLSRRLDEERSTCIGHLFHRLSIALWGGETRVSYFTASHPSPPAAVWTVLSSYSVLGSFSIPVFYLVLAFLYFIVNIAISIPP